MKYPQLVSTKAVNEISDWLIKRLEDLDIEHPGVYSRFLLSLLHMPFKVNAIDLLEDLKQPHHLLNKSNEELKRLAAVESLMEVSAEQNKSNIINLVDELHSKLRKIESNCEDVVVASMNSRTSNSLNSSPISSSKFYKNLKKIKKNHGMESSTKNYYLAFPALSGAGGKNLVSSTVTSTTASSNLAAPVSNETTKPLSADVEMQKETNNLSNFVSWSNLISKKNDDTSRSSKLNEISNGSGSGGSDRMKTPLSRRKRRYGKTTQRKNFPKADTGQFSSSSTIAKSSSGSAANSTVTAAYDNVTFSPKKMQMVNKNSSKKHQRNQYDSSKFTITTKSDIRNNNNFSKNAPKLDVNLTSTGSAPWDMDFKGTWEMDRDLISEFIQQQQQKGGVHRHHQQKKKQQNNDQLIIEDDDEAMLKCLPTKLIVDESPIDDDDPFSAKVKPCNNKEALSISSLRSKFDENVKAIWSDVGGGNDLLKPLTYNNDDGMSLSLASSFTSEKNSLSLFNFSNNEQTTAHHFEVNAPSSSIAPSSEIFHQHQQQQFYKNMDYDYNNNNNPMAFYGGRGVMSKSSSSFTVSPKHQSDQMIKSSDFIKSGTNLQTSIWSDGDFPSDAESLVFKEVADPREEEEEEANATIYKKLSSIGAEIKHWQNSNNSSSNSSNHSSDCDVTLFNHSEKSAFKKFRPLLTSTIIRANYHPLNKSQSDRTVVVESLESSENYLTSEKTHFPPIIRDGHTFVIDNNWDDIKYERSPSGEHLMYKNRRYKCWNKDGSNDLDLMGIENDANEFTIKYMVSENDKEVQTNENDFVIKPPPSTDAKSFLEINEEYCKRKIYDEYFKSSSEAFIGNKNKWRYINNTEDSNDYSFFSVNRVKENSNTLNPPAFHNILLSSNSSSSSICTITSSYDAAAVDQYQFESWRNLKVENNNNDRPNRNPEYRQICMHRLWEQCLTCSKNNEDMHLEKPLPASRLMKDELQLDGDEIMNVIQNLYITGDYCDDDEEKEENCDDFDMNHVYMNMILDDSMDGTCEDENKFYEPTTVDAKNQKNFASNIIEKDLLNLENFDEITLTKMQWQMDNDGKKQPDMSKDYEKYLKLLNWIKTSLVTSNNNNGNMASQYTAAAADNNNNNCQSLSLSEMHRPKNRKRRHSTCQNFLENKRTSHEEGFTYRLNLDTNSLSPLQPPAPQFTEDYSNLFFDAAKMLKVNIEKILLISNPCIELEDNSGNIEGANYYRNILQQQHALIKQLDLSRPLTR